MEIPDEMAPLVVYALENEREQARGYAFRYGSPLETDEYSVEPHEDSEAARAHFGGLNGPHCISAGSAVEPEGYTIRTLLDHPFERPDMAHDRVNAYPFGVVDEAFDCIMIESP